MKTTMSNSVHVPIKFWIDLQDIEASAMDQIRNVANLPFAKQHIVVLPDCHTGYGMPIGTVLATKDVIIPNAVGVDIGCGMSACRTSLTELTREQLANIFGSGKGGGLRAAIPVGLRSHKTDQVWTGFADAPDIELINQHLGSARKQLGTLGSGNHFLEIQQDGTGRIWVMLHSGSRGFGYKIAKHYNDLAKELNERWYFKGDNSLAFLPIDTYEGQEYIEAMTYAVLFAKENRQRMMFKTMEIFKNHLKKYFDINVGFGEVMDVAHNYAALENHFGENLWVHRKGATRAQLDEVGIIPGSQGSSSYIVLGKGNAQSLMSCSHGAGRKLSRTGAKKQLDLAEEQKHLDDMGVLHSVRGNANLDEASGAYKDIDTVIADQSDLVDVLYKLRPLGVIKG